MNTIIRDAVLEDAEAIASIYNESILAPEVITFDTECKNKKDILNMMTKLKERECILVLEVEKKVIGWGQIKFYSDRFGYSRSCETSVYVSFESQGKGYGPIMKKHIIELCRGYNYHHIVARISANNIKSIEYNKKLGFEVVGVQKEIGYLRGKWYDVVIMQLLL